MNSIERYEVSLTLEKSLEEGKTAASPIQVAPDMSQRMTLEAKRLLILSHFAPLTFRAGGGTMRTVMYDRGLFAEGFG